MIVEWLEFWLNPATRPLFLAEDARIWTPVLAAQSGFLRKEYWQPTQGQGSTAIDLPDAERLVTVIHWQSRELWKAIPIALLQATEAQFAQAVGADNYKLLACQEFPVISA